ncbi:MAG: helix-turn-helix domain-containing protein [Actinomycetota bacterium]|nr:helix-turn-helix domain-containing protein [Actinomycetota bacterium]
MNDRWPYPGDTPIVRARRIALAYRAVAEHHAPHECADLDAVVRGMGETWAVPIPVATDPDELLTPAEAAQMLCVSTAVIRNLRLRGRLPGHHDGRGYRYKTADVTDLFLTKRGRRRSASDTLTTNGTTVPETG